ncbi:MAG TPA: hypothetical protein VFS30_18190 [Dehalococcoidia bacterium]|nr:hypothetical protein [Dehalococcoidia bacterium]
MSDYLLLLGFVGLTAGLAMLVAGMVRHANHPGPTFLNEPSADDAESAVRTIADLSTAAPISTWPDVSMPEPRSVLDAIEPAAIETPVPVSISDANPQDDLESTSLASESTENASALAAQPETEEGAAVSEACTQPLELDVKTFGPDGHGTVAADAVQSPDEEGSPSEEDVPPVAAYEAFVVVETERTPAAMVSAPRTVRPPLEKKLTNYARRWLRDFLDYQPPGK